MGNQALLGLEALHTLDLTDNVISTLQENPFSHLPRLHTLLLNTLQGVTAECAHPEGHKGE